MTHRTLSFISAVTIAIASLGSFALAQTASHMDALRDKIKADKKVVVSHNMELTDAEAKKFWPIYDEYQKGLEKLNERITSAVTDYANAYNQGKVEDSTAKRLMKEVLSIDEAELKMRKNAMTKLGKALPAVKAAKYMQIESKIRAIIKYELADAIPLVD